MATSGSEFAIQPDAQATFDLVLAGRTEEARAMAETLLAHEPDNALAVYLRGLVYKAQGDLNNAIVFYNKALRLKPDFKRACADLAHALQQAGQINLSIKMYEHLIRIEQNEGRSAIKKRHLFRPQLQRGLMSGMRRRSFFIRAVIWSRHSKPFARRFASLLTTPT